MTTSEHRQIARQDGEKQPTWFQRLHAALPGVAKHHQRAKRLDRAHALYQAAVQRARSPALYLEYGVPDSENGRFEMIVLHLVLMVRALRNHGREAKALAQTMIDVFVADMDRSLRESGVGDLSVGKKVKQMAGCYHARADALDSGIDARALERIGDIIQDGLFDQGNDAPADGFDYARIAGYVLRQDEAMAALDPPVLLSGNIETMPEDP